VRRLDQGWPGDVRDAARPCGQDWPAAAAKID